MSVLQLKCLKSYGQRTKRSIPTHLGFFSLAAMCLPHLKPASKLFQSYCETTKWKMWQAAILDFRLGIF
jgi:hypothetical protein